MIPINYEPQIRDNPNTLSKNPSAWGNIPSIIKDLMIRFDIKNNICLEFGVEYGYSTSAFANYFDKVIGVDTFLGDVHAGIVNDHYELTKNTLNENFKNITLIQSSYQDFIKNCDESFDLIHIDIVHDYENTFACGDWSCQHSNVVIFHDTISFPDVMRSCIDLSNKHNMDFFNYQESNGLGILVKK